MIRAFGSAKIPRTTKGVCVPVNPRNLPALSPEDPLKRSSARAATRSFARTFGYGKRRFAAIRGPSQGALLLCAGALLRLRLGDEGSALC